MERISGAGSVYTVHVEGRRMEVFTSNVCEHAFHTQRGRNQPRSSLLRQLFERNRYIRFSSYSLWEGARRDQEIYQGQQLLGAGIDVVDIENGWNRCLSGIGGGNDRRFNVVAVEQQGPARCNDIAIHFPALDFEAVVVVPYHCPLAAGLINYDERDLRFRALYDHYSRGIDAFRGDRLELVAPYLIIADLPDVACAKPESRKRHHCRSTLPARSRSVRLKSYLAVELGIMWDNYQVIDCIQSQSHSVESPGRWYLNAKIHD